MNKLFFPVLFKKNILFANIAFFVVLFSISIGIRFDNLRAPLGRGHEWITGHVLTTHSIYEKNGMGHYYYSPVWTYDHPAENYMISSWEFKDKNNSSYYVSYPPLCFLLPYIGFKATGVTPGVTAIRVFGLLLHLSCSFIILLTMYSFFGKNLKEAFFLPAFIGAAIYIFSAGNLWFHSNIYFADMLVQLFVIWLIYLLVLVFKNPDRFLKPTFVLLIGLVNFLGVYTEWLQVFMAFTTCVVAFFYCFKNRIFLRLLLVLSLSTLLSLSLTLFQYTRICGYEKLIKVSVDKYNQRSGRTEKSESWASVSSKDAIVTLTQSYERHYSHILNIFYVSILLLISILLLSKLKFHFFRSKKHIIIPVFILSISLLLHIIIFFNFNVIHDFGTLKFSTLFSLVIGVSFYALSVFVRDFSLPIKFVCLALFLGIYIYFVSESINLYYKNNNSTQVTYFQVNVGEVVRKYARPDELVFVRPFVTPVTYFYAQRTVLETNTLKDAMLTLNNLKYDKGIFIDADFLNTGLIKRVVRFTNKGDSTVLAVDYLPETYTVPVKK